jgi:hypothetical protein
VDLPSHTNKRLRIGLSPREVNDKLGSLLDGDRQRKLTPEERKEFVELLPRLEHEIFKDYILNAKAEAIHAEKAVKAENAEIPTFLWDDRIAFLRKQSHLSTLEVAASNVIRNALHRHWTKLVVRSWWEWWTQHQEHIKHVEPRYWKVIFQAGVCAVDQAKASSYWEWKGGSGVFFWRWDESYMRDAALGLDPMWTGAPPAGITRQAGLGTTEVKALLKEKLTKMRERRYITPLSRILSTINYFAVQKGDEDIRPVYDGTKSGLNRALWAPWFPLPDLAGLIRALEDQYWCIDNDYGEMFHNFWMHPELRAYSGVDLTPLFGSQPDGSPLIEAWSRLPMGERPSPYGAVQNGRRLKRKFFGDRQDPNNVFRWDYVETNLPGSESYQPGRAWYSKRRRSGETAADAQDFVDDLRGTGPTAEDAWQVGSRIGKQCSYYGVQDATRKRRVQTQTPGAWAGTVVGTVPDDVYVAVTQEKWGKTKSELARAKIAHDIATGAGGDNTVELKMLEQVVGFLVHVARAYPLLRVYLNGLYATMNEWRPDRDEEGWKLCDVKVDYDSFDPPARVKVLARLGHDLRALAELTEAVVPPQVPARPSKVATSRWIFGDASGPGFGSSDWKASDKDVIVDYGLWKADWATKSTSNQREFLNTVQIIEGLDERDEIDEATEFWIFTDNFFSESCFYKGGGAVKSQPMLDLVLRLHKIMMKGKAFIHVVWVAGKRMIAQGTDGLSRGDLTNGVMRGLPMLEFVPLNKSVLDRRKGPILDWLRTTMGGEECVRLNPQDWLLAPHDEDGTFLWTPPPAIADVAVYQMAEAIHLRPWNTHVFIVPNLMTARWRKMLGKASDLVVTLPFDPVVWPKESEYERLTFAISFPLLARDPWRVKRSPLFRDVETTLRGMSGTPFAQYGDRLREFWTSARALQSMPSGVARSLLSH